MKAKDSTGVELTRKHLHNVNITNNMQSSRQPIRIKTPHYCRLENHSVLSGGAIKSGFFKFYYNFSLVLNLKSKDKDEAEPH